MSPLERKQGILPINKSDLKQIQHMIMGTTDNEVITGKKNKDYFQVQAMK